MDAVRIKLFDDVFSVRSVSDPSEISAVSEDGFADVYILPSLNADFSLKAYRKRGESIIGDISVPLCAAAYLAIRQGLPLDEFIFETDRKIFTVHSRRGRLTVSIPFKTLPKISQRELCGCETEYTDFADSACIRVIHTEDAEFFDASLLSRLVLSEDAVAHAAVLSYSDGDRLGCIPYKAHSAEAHSSALIYAYAAYNEWIHSGGKKMEYLTDDGSEISVSRTSVAMSVTPRVI